jgi:hypothetical protein
MSNELTPPRIEILFFDGCPNVEAAEELVGRVTENTTQVGTPDETSIRPARGSFSRLGKPFRNVWGSVRSVERIVVSPLDALHTMPPRPSWAGVRLSHRGIEHRRQKPCVCRDFKPSDGLEPSTPFTI